jgi:phosphatidylcholine synthase
VAVLAALTFVPFRFIHPLRVRRLRGLNLALLAIWGGLALWAVWRDMAPAEWVTAGLCAIGLYVLAAGFFRGSDEAPAMPE